MTMTTMMMMMMMMMMITVMPHYSSHAGTPPVHGTSSFIYLFIYLLKHIYTG